MGQEAHSLSRRKKWPLTYLYKPSQDGILPNHWKGRRRDWKNLESLNLSHLIVTGPLSTGRQESSALSNRLWKERDLAKPKRVNCSNCTRKKRRESKPSCLTGNTAKFLLWRRQVLQEESERPFRKNCQVFSQSNCPAGLLSPIRILL